MTQQVPQPTALQRSRRYLRSLVVSGSPYERPDPQLFAVHKKYTILFLISLAAMLAPMSSTVYLPAILDVQYALNTNANVINTTISVFILTMGVAPLVWATCSDHFHTRRWIYLSSFLLHTISSILCAVSTSLSLFFVMRVVNAVGGSAVQSIGAGTVSDIFFREQRGRALGYFAVGPLLGPLIGPLIGGYLAQYLGWRSIFWFLAILGCSINLLIFFLLPETYRPFDYELHATPAARMGKDALTVNLERQAIQSNAPKNKSQPHVDKVENSESSNTASEKDKEQELEADRSVDAQDPSSRPIPPKAKRGSLNPLIPLAWMRYPFVILVSFAVGTVFGSMFLINTILPRIFYEQYGFGSGETGLSFLAPGAGNILGSLIGGRLSDRNVKRLQKKHPEGKAGPEMRLATVWISQCIIIPAGAIIFGWTLRGGVTVAAPLIGLFIFGLGCMMTFNAVSTFFVDAFPGRSASAMAVNNFVRNLLAAVASLIAQPVWLGIGTGWMSILIAGWNLLAVAGVYLVIRYGESWRHRAGFIMR